MTWERRPERSWRKRSEIRLKKSLRRYLSCHVECRLKTWRRTTIFLSYSSLQRWMPWDDRTASTWEWWVLLEFKLWPMWRVVERVEDCFFFGIRSFQLLLCCTHTFSDENDGFWFLVSGAASLSDRFFQPSRSSTAMTFSKCWNTQSWKKSEKRFVWNEINASFFRIWVLIFLFFWENVVTTKKQWLWDDLSCFLCSVLCSDSTEKDFVEIAFSSPLPDLNGQSRCAKRKRSSSAYKKITKHDWIWGEREWRSERCHLEGLWELFLLCFASRRCITGRRLHSECIPILIKFLSVIYCELI